MSDTTGISWTDATFNPWWGCSKVSPACDHCYAERDAKRYQPHRTLWGVNAERRIFGEKHWNEPRRWNARALREGRRIRVFCASMADVFDNHAPEGEREKLWQLIAETPALDWLLLTKRIGNAATMMPRNFGGQGFANVWLGATVIDQNEADRDIPKLLATPARVRFLSIEPMLGPVDLSAWLPIEPDHPAVGGWRRRTKFGEPDSDLSWVIAGGESGPHARPAHRDWFRGLRDQCAAASVPFHFKQWGEWAPNWLCVEGTLAAEQPGSMWMDRMGKKIAGRALDGVEHNGFPTP